jgi:hypothetical protein
MFFFLLCLVFLPVQVLWAQFLPDGNQFTAATGGVKHVRFWTVGPSGLTSKKGVFGAKAKLQPMLCATVVGDNLVTGTVSGEFYIWGGNTVVRVRSRFGHSAVCVMV